MATTPAGADLTEEHRRAQAMLASLAAVQVLQLWRGFDVRDIDESWSRVEPALMAVIDRDRRVSEDLSLVYFHRFRTVEGVDGEPPTGLRVPQDWQTPATVSLRVTGPVTAKRLVGQKAPDPAGVALVRVSGAVTRIVGNGGREIVKNGVRRDRRALGYARVTSFKPCAFCAMLAGRGPVYKATTAEFDAHDHCGCTAEPVYRRDTRWPGRARDFQALYRTSTRGADNPELAFRHAYEAAA